MVFDTDTKTLLSKIAKIDSLDIFSGVGCISCTDIRENLFACNYYPFAKVGECIIFAHADSEIMRAFIKHICRIAYYGNEFEHGTRIKVSTDIQGSVLCYTKKPLQFKPEVDQPKITETLINKQINFCDFIDEISAEIDSTGAHIVFIENLEEFTHTNKISYIEQELNNIARLKNVAILCGFNFANKLNIDNTAPYFLQHDRNLCFLIGNSDNGQNYFTFIFGQPEHKIYVYGIDEDGNLCIPKRLAKKLILKDLLPKLLAEPTSQKELQQRIFGAYHGQYQLSTITHDISVAKQWGFIHNIKGKNKRFSPLIALGSDGDLNTENTAIIAKTDRYRDKKHTIECVPFIQFGDFKIVCVSDGDSDNGLQDFYMLYFCVLSMVESIINGRGLDFKVETKRKNILIVDIENKASKNFCDRVLNIAARSDFDNQINILQIDPKTNESQFVERIEKETERLKPDFVFILNLESLSVNNFLLLLEDIKRYSKQKNVACIAELYRYPDTTDIIKKYKLHKDAFCFVSSFYEREGYSFKDMSINAGKHYTPDLYEFRATNNEREISCRYLQIGRNVKKADSETLKQALVIRDLWYCNNVPIKDIDCNKNVLSWAEKNGLIAITGKGDNRHITFKI